MACGNPVCTKNHDFETIALLAKKRFVDGYDTVTLLAQACSEREKEEIALVCLLDVEDDQMQSFQLSCEDKSRCKIVLFRTKVKTMIAEAIRAKRTSSGVDLRGSALE